MPGRPRRLRRVAMEPGVTYFKPRAVPLSSLEEATLTVGEFEALRLGDAEKMDQARAAKRMNVSQPTFSRLLASARQKTADAICNGKAIQIRGGRYTIMRRGMRRGRRMRGGRFR